MIKLMFYPCNSFYEYVYLIKILFIYVVSTLLSINCEIYSRLNVINLTILT